LCLRGIGRQRDLEARVAQVQGDQFGDRRFVFYNQNLAKKSQ
jgi:hypothetical protein